MYYCQVTGKISEEGEKLQKIVVQTREREYKGKIYNEEMRVYEDVTLGYGTEIVKEINASEEGLDAWMLMTPEQQKALLKSLNIV